MPNVVLIKNNIVTSVVFKIDADIAVLSDHANCGDLYDPVSGIFTTPAPFVPPAPEIPQDPPSDQA